MADATSMAIRFGRAAALAGTIALASCESQMLVGSMKGESTLDSGPIPGKGSGGTAGSSPGVPTDVAGSGNDGRDASLVADIADRSVDASRQDDIAPSDDVAPPRPDGATCPSSARAPLVCVGADASVPETPIEECLAPSRTIYQENQLLSCLRADAQGVYWLGNDLGLRVLRQGAAAAELLAFVGPRPFAIDDDALYFLTGGDAARLDLRKIKRDGTGLTLIASGANSTTAIALGPDRVYFNPEVDSLASAPKAGNGVVETIVTGRIVENLVADATHVYWMERSNDPSNETWAIWRALHGSQTIELVAAGISGARALWEQGDGLIVLSDELRPSGDHVTSYFLEVPKAGGCPRALLSLPTARYANRITTVAIDGQGIYWTAADVMTSEYSVWYAPRAGGIAVKRSGGLHDENLALSPTQVLSVDRIPALWTFATLIQAMDRP